MAAQTTFRIDVSINDLLVHSGSHPPAAPPKPTNATFPTPVFPQYQQLLADPGPSVPPNKRHWDRSEIMRKVRGWLVPYIRSRVLSGDFHPITAYLFVEYKCNID